MRSKVDFPEPLRPTRQIWSPAATASSAPESRGVTPKVRLISCSRSNGGGMATEITRDGGGQGIVSVCQDQRTALRGVEMTQLMHGFPPSADTQVTLANWRQAPFSRWAFHHVRELVPSAEIANDPADVHEWPIDHVELGDIPIATGGARPLSFDEFLADTSTDGIVLARGGRIVFETIRQWYDRNDAAHPD